MRNSLPPLVIVPGFACSAAMMQPLANALAEHFSVTILPLPALSVLEANEPSGNFLEALLAHLSEQIPPQATLLGWSLGGMLALQLAARRMDVVRVITLCANARFCADDAYPAAMQMETNQAFNAAFAAMPAATLKQFYGLVAHGDDAARELTKRLRGEAPVMSVREHAYLVLLSRLDNRELIAREARPVFHLFAEQDALVPKQAARAVQALNRRHRVMVLLRASHGVAVSTPERIVAALQAFDVIEGAQ